MESSRYGLTLGESSSVFQRKMQEVAARPGLKKIVLDLSGLTYVHSAGVGSLVSAFAAAKRAGVSVVLANPSRKIDDVLRITRLMTVFPVVESVEEALKLQGTSD